MSLIGDIPAGTGSCFLDSTSLCRKRRPCDDTVLTCDRHDGQPIIGLVRVPPATIVDVTTHWRDSRRSTSNVTATVLSLSVTLFLGALMVGEWLDVAWPATTSRLPPGQRDAPSRLT
jgi:hypothetical protein